MKAVLPDKTFRSDKYSITESDLDFHGCLSLKKAMELMQNSATAHADALGFGWSALNKAGILWVLSKIKVRFFKNIDKSVETVNVVTWPLKPDRFFAAREFVCTDKNGEQLFSATTVWSLIDFRSRRLLNTKVMDEFYGGEYSELRSDIPHDFKRVRKDDGFTFSEERTVKLSELDRNMHVNNTNYINYALDALKNFSVDNGVTEFELCYHSECRLNETIGMYVSVRENAAETVGEKDGQICFTAYFCVK